MCLCGDVKNILSPRTCALPIMGAASPHPSVWTLSPSQNTQELNLESKVRSGIDGEGLYVLLVLTYCPYLQSETNLNLSG